MKKIVWAFILTTLIFFVSVFIVIPIISSLGYGSVGGSYHAVTHSILLSLIFTVILCTMIIIEEINKIRIQYDDNKKE